MTNIDACTLVLAGLGLTLTGLMALASAHLGAFVESSDPAFPEDAFAGRPRRLRRLPRMVAAGTLVPAGASGTIGGLLCLLL